MAESTFCMGIPDSKGNIIYQFGHLEDGKVVIDKEEIEPDPTWHMTKDLKQIEFYRHGQQSTSNYEEFKITSSKIDNNATME